MTAPTQPARQLSQKERRNAVSYLKKMKASLDITHGKFNRPNATPDTVLAGAEEAVAQANDLLEFAKSLQDSIIGDEDI